MVKEAMKASVKDVGYTWDGSRVPGEFRRFEDRVTGIAQLNGFGGAAMLPVPAPMAQPPGAGEEPSAEYADHLRYLERADAGSSETQKIKLANNDASLGALIRQVCAAGAADLFTGGDEHKISVGDGSHYYSGRSMLEQLRKEYAEETMEEVDLYDEQLTDNSSARVEKMDLSKSLLDRAYEYRARLTRIMRSMNEVCRKTKGFESRTLTEAKVIASVHKRLPVGEYEQHQLEKLKPLSTFKEYFEEMRKFDRAKYDTMASTGNFGVNGVNGNPSARDGKIKRCHHCNSDKHLKHACPKLQRLREGRRVLDHKSKVDRKRKRDESDSRKPCRNLAMTGECKYGDKCRFSHKKAPESKILCTICTKQHVGEQCPRIAKMFDAVNAISKQMGKKRAKTDHDEKYERRRHSSDSGSDSD